MKKTCNVSLVFLLFFGLNTMYPLYAMKNDVATEQKSERGHIPIDSDEFRNNTRPYDTERDGDGINKGACRHAKNCSSSHDCCTTESDGECYCDNCCVA